jgi:hypothetical protein
MIGVRTRESGTKVYQTNTGADRIKVIKSIVDSKAYAKVDGFMVDLFTASAIVQVHTALSERNRIRFESMSIIAMAKTALELIGAK